MSVSLLSSDKTGTVKTDGAGSVDDFLSGYSNAAVIEDDDENEEPEEGQVLEDGRDKKQETDMMSDPVINGLTMLTIIDMVLPSLIVFAYKKITKKDVKIPMSKLQLRPRQKKDLESLADRVAERINFKDGDPTLILLISMGSMYYANLLNVVHELETS